jgi:hypothetical protein
MQDRTDDAEASHTCPGWCRRPHPPGAHPEDGHHASTPRHAVVLTGDPMLEPDDRATASAIVGRLARRADSGLTWLEVLSEEGRDVRLVVTVDSAHRLCALLEELLGMAEA